MRNLLLILLFITNAICSTAVANVAMPGFFGIGGSSDFQLLFPEDSVYLGKISMNREWVAVHLYNGFAVVKGEYEMQNLTDEEITMDVGYPLNSIYEGNDTKTYMVQMDTLHAIRVLVNGSPVSVIKVQNKPPTSDYDQNSYRDWEKLVAEAANWQIWETTFAPATTTTITVYFMIRTNRGMVIQGYDKAYPNGFAYLLESGKPWAGTIRKGRVMMENKEGETDFQGLFPLNKFSISPEGNALLWDFEDLEPNRRDNVVIRYGERPYPYNLGPQVAKSQDYFLEIDRMEIKTTSATDWEAASFPDMFEVKKIIRTGTVIGLVMMLTIYGLPILVFLAFILLGVWMYRRAKRSGKEKNRPKA